jgi:hypothetical protein
MRPKGTQASAGATLLLWTDSTEHDPSSQESGGSTIGGSTATIVLEAVHGTLDAGMDGYHRSWDIGAPPSGAWGVKITLVTAAGVPTTNSTGGVVDLFLAAASEVPAATNDGLLGGCRMTTGSVWRAAEPKKFGSSNSNGDSIGDPSSLPQEAIVLLDGTGKLSQIATCSTGATTSDASTLSASTADVPTSVFIIVAVGLAAASPSAGITMPLGQVSYEWLTH